jgi:hypothetical protein
VFRGSEFLDLFIAARRIGASFRVEIAKTRCGGHQVETKIVWMAKPSVIAEIEILTA